MYYVCLVLSLLLGGAAIGALIGLGRMAIEDRSVFLGFIALLMGGTLGGLSFLPIGLYLESQQPTFALVKRDWRCTASHTDTTVIMQKVGDVTVPQTITEEVCDRYERRR